MMKVSSKSVLIVENHNEVWKSWNLSRYHDIICGDYDENILNNSTRTIFRTDALLGIRIWIWWSPPPRVMDWRMRSGRPAMAAHRRVKIPVVLGIFFSKPLFQVTGHGLFFLLTVNGGGPRYRQVHWCHLIVRLIHWHLILGRLNREVVKWVVL
jgi:hypothetical protein